MRKKLARGGGDLLGVDEVAGLVVGDSLVYGVLHFGQAEVEEDFGDVFDAFGEFLGAFRVMGIVAEKFGVKTALISGGVLCVVSVLGAAYFLPKFVKYDGREGVKHKEFEESMRMEKFAKEKTVEDEMMRVSEGEF